MCNASDLNLTWTQSGGAKTTPLPERGHENHAPTGMGARKPRPYRNGGAKTTPLQERGRENHAPTGTGARKPRPYRRLGIVGVRFPDPPAAPGTEGNVFCGSILKMTNEFNRNRLELRRYFTGADRQPQNHGQGLMVHRSSFHP